MSNDTVLTGKRWKVHYDIIRLVAIFLVIFNHTPAVMAPLNLITPFNTTGDSLPALLQLLIAAVDKIAVPLFFMISGALLLPREETLRDVLVKRVLRFACVILIFHLIQATYCVCAGLVHVNNITNFLKGFLRACYTGEGNWGMVNVSECWAYWFLYAYLGFLFMLPFLRRMVSGMSNQLFYYLFILQMVWCVLIPSAHIIACGENDSSNHLKYLPLCSDLFVYALAGYFVENRIDTEKLTKKHFTILAAGSAFFIVAGWLMLEIARVKMNQPFINPNIPRTIPFLLLPGITLVLALKKICTQANIPVKVKKWLQILGGGVFCTMIVENILRLEFKSFFPDYDQSYLPSVWVTSLTWIVGLLIGIVVKKVPVIRKLI